MNAQTTFVLFTLGPVQSFIKAARTVRDLWSGSYLLSYLTFRAMKAVADKCGASAIVFPNYDELPLTKWFAKQPHEGLLEPCIPNRFLAEVPNDRKPSELAEAAETACRGAWKEIAEKVRKFLYKELSHDSYSETSELWRQQIDGFFEVYTATMPVSAETQTSAQALLAKPTGDLWRDAHELAQRALAARKGRRHFPEYAPEVGEFVPQKDSLLGTYEHVGPGAFKEVETFWETASTAWDKCGTMVSAAERLCAVSLVKRFAWAHYFAPKFGFQPKELRFLDTATRAARNWLAAGDAIDPDAVRTKHDDWSGQWLHWPSPEPPGDPDARGKQTERTVPPEVWSRIQAKKRAQKAPPSYYAAFMFDGDSMGDRFGEAKNTAEYRELSKALAAFALARIEKLVGRYNGELLYAGGDDALCLLPTDTALECVAEINSVFRANWLEHRPSDKPATISGGLVVAHYKEDLRFVLEQARKAEHAAKEAGRDRLALAVCRRSGEHSSAVVPWGFVPTVGAWVKAFRDGASDRWAYKLRAELPVVEESTEMFKLELRRQLNRTEDDTKRLLAPSGLLAAFDELPNPRTFVTLVQSASFLARGRDE